MSDETTYTGIRGEWRDLVTPLANHPPGLEHLEAFRAKLDAILARTTDITMQQAALTASKQELSQELRVEMVRGQRLAAVLRKVIKEHYGPQSEQLAAFGLQPFRGRKPRAEEPPPVSEVSSQAHDTNDR